MRVDEINYVAIATMFNFVATDINDVSIVTRSHFVATVISMMLP